MSAVAVKTKTVERKKEDRRQRKDRRKRLSDRRKKLRRGDDIEAYQMSQQALNEARQAAKQSKKNADALEKHLVICEAQNVTVIEKLARQDKVLWWILTTAGTAALAVIGGLATFVLEHVKIG